MNNIITFFQNKIHSRDCLGVGILVIAMILGNITAFGQEEEKITTIHIVTPEWEDTTNADGTGLWFDIVRKVYEPVGITMTYEIMPWKRAMSMIEANEADAMLGEYSGEDKLTPQYPLDIERTAVVFKKEKVNTWKGVKTLTGKNVVWLRGYDYHVDTELSRIQFNWYEVDNYGQAWGMLAKDRVDFYMDALSDIEEYAAANTVDMTPYRVEIVWTTNVYLAFAPGKKSEKLMEIYDQRIPALLASGELQQIFEQWEAEFPPFEPEDE